MARGRRVALWALLVLVLGAVSFTGASSAGAYVGAPPAPPVAPPVVEVPIVPNPGPSNPAQPDEMPLGPNQDWFWCHFNEDALGCPDWYDEDDHEWDPENPWGDIPELGTGLGVEYIDAQTGWDPWGLSTAAGTTQVSAVNWFMDPVAGYPHPGNMILFQAATPNPTSDWTTYLTFNGAAGQNLEVRLKRTTSGCLQIGYTFNGGSGQDSGGCTLGPWAAGESAGIMLSIQQVDGGQITLYVGYSVKSANAATSGMGPSLLASLTGTTATSNFPWAKRNGTITLGSPNAGGIGPLMVSPQGGANPPGASWGNAMNLMRDDTSTITYTPWAPTEPEVEPSPELAPEPTPSPSTVAPPATLPAPTTEFTPEEGTDNTLAERIGGFFGDLIGALSALITWLVESLKTMFEHLYQVIIQSIVWLFESLRSVLIWLTDQIIAWLRIIVNMLGQVLNWMIELLTQVVRSIVSLGALLAEWLSWLGETVWAATAWLLEALLEGLQTMFEYLLQGITALFEYLLAGLEGLLDFLFIPDVSIEVLLAPIIAETPLRSWVDEGTGTVDVIVTNIDDAAMCGPTIEIPEPLNWSVKAPNPSDSGCPGNGPGGARTAEDNQAGDVYGWRNPVRAFIAVFMGLAFLSRISRLMPWGGKDQGEPAEDALEAAPA